MGKLRDFLTSLRPSNKSMQKGIEYIGDRVGNVTTGNVFYIGNKNKQVPFLENIYNVFASQMSLLEIKHYKVENNKDTNNYNIKNSAILRCFGYEVNEKQTNTDFMHAFFYNVIKYGNGIAVIDPYYNGKWNYILKKKMELKMYNLDVSECEFGHAYIEENETLYLVVRYKNTNEIDVIPYHLVVHLRYKPQQIYMN